MWEGQSGEVVVEEVRQGGGGGGEGGQEQQNSDFKANFEAEPVDFRH